MNPLAASVPRAKTRSVRPPANDPAGEVGMAQRNGNGRSLHIATLRRGRVANIRVNGRFDFSARKAFLDAVRVSLQDAAAEIEVDLAAADYMDSSAVGLILIAGELAEAAGKILSLSGAKGIVEQTLRDAQLHRLFVFK